MPAATSSIFKSANATVFVNDLDRAQHFYTDLLGFELLFRAGPHFAMLSLNGFQLGLHPADESTSISADRHPIQIGLDVTIPIAQAVRELSARGVKFQSRDGSPVFDDGSVKLAFFKDPDGHVLYLCEHNSG